MMTAPMTNELLAATSRHAKAGKFWDAYSGIRGVDIRKRLSISKPEAQHQMEFYSASLTPILSAQHVSGGKAAATITAEELRLRMATPCDCHKRRQTASSNNSMSCYQPYLADDAKFGELLQYIQSFLAMHKLDQDKFATWI